MIRKLLVGYDGSEEADAAFRFALDLALKYGAKVEVLAVAQIPEPPTVAETAAVLENAMAHYASLFVELRKKAALAGVSMRAEVKVGHPAEQILHRADQEQVDAIVMGHQTRGLFGQWLAGSVAKRVLDHARCMVIVVKDKHRV